MRKLKYCDKQDNQYRMKLKRTMKNTKIIIDKNTENSPDKIVKI